ncbi:GntR family transcriptional regulator [Thalassobaculum sp. OXR-137]|uniref:GntR family transcriptional regulator n=1 Tax=Thalassobaculum sp. OXR-137 TaxID=3100173 RepID=UPI002AC895B8|nr:GntR family transcriptional regulator [Thalassobaculum sp. OXR-137]WPZ36426.1 GntR family transcriptional regulator [Thalassobaculum sp. OXR-137]
MDALASKPDLTAQAHHAIREAIMAMDLAPGTPLAQEDLAERLGVSRQPVSHALVLLRREGLVVDRGRKGQMVAPIDPDRLLALYQVRGAIDRLAARLATARLATDRLATDRLATAGRDPVENPAKRFERLIEDGREACAGGEIDALVKADLAFHQAIHALSGNDEIERTAAGFWPHMVRSMRVVLEDSKGRDAIWDEHAAIAEAILSGDPAKAGSLAADHAERTGELTHQRLSRP